MMHTQTGKDVALLQEEKAVQFLQTLIRINSVNPPGNEMKVAEKIAAYTKEAGLHTRIKKLTNNRANIIVHLKGKDRNRAPLIFSGHLDTVPIGDIQWKYDPFSGEIVDGKVYGRGSCDMKGGVAALIEAMVLLKTSNNPPDSDVVFVGTAGEEIDCMGASALIKEEEITLKNAGAMIIAEPSNNKVFSAHKGALWLEIKVFGRTAHSSMPGEGINAITHMNEVLNKLREFKFSYQKEHHLLGKPTLNIGTVSGGVNTNVVPDQCSITVDIRTIPEIKHEEIIKDMNNLLSELKKELNEFKTEINIINNLPALENEENNKFVQLAMEVNHELNGMKMEEKGANYYTDGSIYGSSLNIPIIIYGPGDEKLAHQPDEHIDIRKFIQSIQYYAELARRY